MHYYQFNIGDYQSHTAHLTDLEDLAYRRMLDWCYLHEKPLPLDSEEIARLVRMRTHSECIAVVLREYFKKTESGWISSRVLLEMDRVGEKSSKARASAKARWDANAKRTQSEGNATQDTLHKTQDTLPKKNTVVPPAGVTEFVWQDWLKLRKTKKAPVTQTAIDGIVRESVKAGVSLQTVLETCCERGWTGFKAEWMQSQPTHHDKNMGAARAIFGDERNFNVLKIT
jgi:uncharacterized protein YdaU (DUF1376 family)